MNRKDWILLDACVLVGFPLADTVLRCAEDPAFYYPLWSDTILVEVRTALTGKLNLSAHKADGRIAAMKKAFPEALVDGFQPLEPCLQQINPGDRHVLGAAIRGGAGRILTLNTRHFPEEAVAPFQIEMVSPADIIREWFHQDADLLMKKIEQQASDTRRTREQIFMGLSRFGIPELELRTMLAVWEVIRDS